MTISAARLMDAATGAEVPDLLVSGGMFVNTFTREIGPADIAIVGDRVAGVFPPGSVDGRESVDVSGQFLVPGLVDSHFHVGGSHMDVQHLAQALMARGTTAIATDFYEIYVAGGPDAVRHALDQARRAGLEILFVPPAHLIGLEDVGTFAWRVSVEDMREMLAWPETVGINEPPAAAVLARPPGLVELLEETIRLGKVVVGHAPNEVGRGLQAYVAAGADSDHESRDATEALAKLRSGMRPMMRHGSASPDMTRLVTLARDLPHSTRYMMFCSDETDPGDLMADGHMDTKIRLAVAEGLDPLTALEMATINVAEYYGVASRIGSLAPGRRADIVAVRSLDDFRPSIVIAGGRLVGRTSSPREATPPALVSRVRLGAPLSPDAFHLHAPDDAGATVKARVLGVRDGTLVSEALERELRVEAGVVLPDPGADVLRMAVLERHDGSGRIGRAFVQGFGFRDGAVAMTYCHVFHNMLVVGTSDEDMNVATSALAEDGGGVVVVQRGGVLVRWRLPVVGVLDDRPLAEVNQSFRSVNDALRAIGCPLASPILALSFVALPTIPAYGLTDRGLFDVEKQAFVDVLLGDG